MTIPRSEYEALRAAVDSFEDAAAVAAYHATRGEESVPIEVIDRLLAGENPLRVWRRHRGTNQQALAGAIGIGEGCRNIEPFGRLHMGIPVEYR